MYGRSICRYLMTVGISMSYKDRREASLNVDHSKEIRRFEKYKNHKKDSWSSVSQKKHRIKTFCNFCNSTLYKPQSALRERNYCNYTCRGNEMRVYKSSKEFYKARNERRRARFLTLPPEEQARQNKLNAERSRRCRARKNMVKCT